MEINVNIYVMDIPSCANYNLPNGNDMYQCSVKVCFYSRLSYLITNHPLRIKIEGAHLPSHMIMSETSQISRINLTREKRDKIIISRHADHKTTKEIKGKLLTSLNNADENKLREALSNSREICDNKTLKRFITRENRRLNDNTDLSKPEKTAEYYYQSTVSDEFWLKNGRDLFQN
ncbi:7080_t:CDS:2 [Ambispora gerdemannii]|uniref:7080_t:CDS:1 n=1 Tax=Ambispora gerdemannii TaxID=144530 RepID=A0A9N9C852_9GLOM|nr:7080_t:CDS:2 [Ambispora gerdemannii]